MNITLSHNVKFRVKFLTKLHRSIGTRRENVKNNGQQFYDTIGPPDRVSNLRPMTFARPISETYLQKRYRELREETQEWNQAFWFRHNTNFVRERNQFIESQRAQGKSTLDAEDMSVFYKQFLDKNWQSHVNYNITWYKKNITILFFGIAAKLPQFKFKR